MSDSQSRAVDTLREIISKIEVAITDLDQPKDVVAAYRALWGMHKELAELEAQEASRGEGADVEALRERVAELSAERDELAARLEILERQLKDTLVTSNALGF